MRQIHNDSVNDAPPPRPRPPDVSVFAGFSENADWNVGQLLDAIDDLGDRDNTLIFYIWGDNGASTEGTITGSFNEMTFLNGVAVDANHQLALVADCRSSSRPWRVRAEHQQPQHRSLVGVAAAGAHLNLRGDDAGSALTIDVGS